MAPGARSNLSYPCSNLRSFGSKWIVLKKYLWRCWDFSASHAVIRRPHCGVEISHIQRWIRSSNRRVFLVEWGNSIASTPRFVDWTLHSGGSGRRSIVAATSYWFGARGIALPLPPSLRPCALCEQLHCFISYRTQIRLLLFTSVFSEIHPYLICCYEVKHGLQFLNDIFETQQFELHLTFELAAISTKITTLRVKDENFQQSRSFVCETRLRKSLSQIAIKQVSMQPSRTTSATHYFVYYDVLDCAHVISKWWRHIKATVQWAFCATCIFHSVAILAVLLLDLAGFSLLAGRFSV